MKVHSLVQFDPKIGHYQVLLVRARVDLGVMGIKGCSTLPKATLLETHHQIFSGIFQDTRKRWGSYSSAEKWSMYSNVPQTDRAINDRVSLVY